MTCGVHVGNMGRIKRERIEKVAVKRNIVALAELGLPAFRHGD